jgi:hypothetical protein
LRDGFEEGLHTQGRLPSTSFPDKRYDARKLSLGAVFVVMHRILNQAREPGCLHESCHTICPNFLDVEAEPFRHLVLLEMRYSRGTVSQGCDSAENPGPSLICLLVPPGLCVGWRGRCFFVKHLSQNLTPQEHLTTPGSSSHFSQVTISSVIIVCRECHEARGIGDESGMKNSRRMDRISSRLR